jgi:hypothetical protein
VQRIGYRKELQMENKGPFINELPQTGEVTLLAPRGSLQNRP